MHCDKVFLSSADMSNHVMVDHAVNVLKCGYCCATFSEEKDLKTHMFLHDENDCVLKKREENITSEEFLCNICGKSFNKKNDVFKHKKIFHNTNNIKADANGKFPCDICGKSFARKFHMQFHRERQHDLSDDCDENRDSNLDSDSEKSKYSCDVCSKDYSRKYDLKKHKMKMHSLIENNLSDDGRNIDEFIENGSISLNNGNNDGCEQVRKQICLICRESFESLKELKDHQEKHLSTDDVDDNISYSMSDYSVNSDDISRHLDLPVTSPPQVTAENKSFVRQHKCTLCNHAYTRKHDMMKHRRQAHTIEERRRDPHESSLTKKERELRKKYNCSQCNNSYSRNSDLRKHVYRSHEGETYKGRQVDTIDDMDIEILNRAKIEISGNVVYHCDTCGKNIITKRGYVRHVRIHTGERPFTCHVCGKQYRSSTDLMRHLRCVHDGIKNYQCDVCGRCFANKGTRNDHRRIHTGERPYICHTCGKAFPTPNSIYVHRRIHTDYFPHQCTSCDKRFRRRQQLIHHIRTHTGEKPHACDICGKCFGVKDEVSRHRLTHSGEKPHVCSICGLCFGQKRYLKSHMKTHHGRLL